MITPTRMTLAMVVSACLLQCATAGLASWFANLFQPTQGVVVSNANPQLNGWYERIEAGKEFPSSFKNGYIENCPIDPKYMTHEWLLTGWTKHTSVQSEALEVGDRIEVNYHGTWLPAIYKGKDTEAERVQGSGPRTVDVFVESDWETAATEDGRSYYWNTKTKETSWDHPSTWLPQAERRDDYDFLVTYDDSPNETLGVTQNVVRPPSRVWFKKANGCFISYGTTWENDASGTPQPTFGGWSISDEKGDAHYYVESSASSPPASGWTQASGNRSTCGESGESAKTTEVHSSNLTLKSMTYNQAALLNRLKQ